MISQKFLERVSVVSCFYLINFLIKSKVTKEFKNNSSSRKSSSLTSNLKYIYTSKSDINESIRSAKSIKDRQNVASNKSMGSDAGKLGHKRLKTIMDIKHSLEQSKKIE